MHINRFLLILLLFTSASCGFANSSTIYQPKSFVQVHSMLTVKICTENKKEKKSVCRQQTFGSLASGSVIRHIRNKTFILTAGHVCDMKMPLKLEQKYSLISLNLRIVGHDGIYRDAEIHKIAEDYKNGKDLCLLKIERVEFPNLKLSSGAPEMGEKVYSMSAPIGVYDPPTVPFLTGHYSGNLSNKYHGLVSIPAKGGSSGSAVLNSRGAVVGVIFAVNKAFNRITIIVNHETLEIFLNKNLKL